MKFLFIFAHREGFKVGRMCKLLNVSRSGYHAWIKRPEKGANDWESMPRQNMMCGCLIKYFPAVLKKWSLPVSDLYKIETRFISGIPLIEEPKKASGLEVGR